MARRWRDMALGAGLVVVAGLVGGAIVTLWGVVNIAASAGHPWPVQAFLEIAMQRSVAWQSRGIVAPGDLGDPARIALGAAHFQGGCAMCHGAPGQRSSPVVAHMLPVPPALYGKAGRFGPEEMFWIVRHGLKYAGMPAWSGEGRDDEVWHLVAFLQAFPTMDEATYRRLAWGHAAAGEPSAGEVIEAGVSRAALSACARCHEAPRAAAISGYVPRLAGLDAAYLARSLREYAEGRRESGIMEPVAAELDDEAIRSLAQYYAGQGKAGAAAVGDEAQRRRGLALAVSGDPQRGVPACESCHRGQRPDFPALDGQPAAYLQGQLDLWRRGGRAGYHGRLMQPIAQRMTAAQVADVAAHYAAQAPEAGGR